MVLQQFEVVMVPVTVYRDGPLLVFEIDGEEWPIPPELARRLGSDRRLIDAVRSLTTPNIVRKKKQEADE